MDLYTGILGRWPVKSGLSRSNWLIGIGNPRTGIVANRIGGGSSPIPATGAEISAARSLIWGNRKRDQKIYLTNNVPYAEEIENGSSSQAPSGAVAVTVASLKGK